MKVKEPQWLKSGGNILKMADGDELPAPHNNITFTEGAGRWYPEIGGKYFNNILQLIASSSDVLTAINAINLMLDRHYGLYTASNGVLPKVQTNQNVNGYQSDINSNYEFVNTSGIQYGRNNNRYVNPAQGQSNDRPVNTIWGEDNYYGALTDDRRLLGRKGDYTESEINLLNKLLGTYGIEMYLDPTTEYYKLKYDPLRKTVGGGKYNQLTFLPQEKNKNSRWTDWMEIVPNALVNLINNSYLNKKEKQLQFPLEEAKYRLYKRTSAYLPRTILENLAELARFAGTQNLTSDINQNLRIREQAEENAQKYIMKAADLMSEQNRYDDKMSMETAIYNNSEGVDKWNYNNSLNIKALNNFVLADLKKAERNTNTVTGAWTDLYKNAGEFLKTEKLNQQYKKLGLKQLEASKLKRSIYDQYTNLISDPSKWNRFGSMVDAALQDSDFITTYANGDVNSWGKNFAAMNGKITSLQRDQVLNWMQNSTNANAVRYRGLYEKYLSDLRNSLYSLTNDVDSLMQAWRYANIPTFVNNQLDFSDFNLGPKNQISPLFSKKGGRVDRLSDYTKLYSKELQHVRRNSLEHKKLESKNLQHKLESLNKEQLLLLRSAFK